MTVTALQHWPSKLGLYFRRWFPQTTNSVTVSKPAPAVDGRKLYEESYARDMADPCFQIIYKRSRLKTLLWLKVVETRIDSGITLEEMAKRMGIKPAKLAQIEEDGFEFYPLDILYRYVEALGDGYFLKFTLETPKEEEKKKEDALAEAA